MHYASSAKMNSLHYDRLGMSTCRKIVEICKYKWKRPKQEIKQRWFQERAFDEKSHGNRSGNEKNIL